MMPAWITSLVRLRDTVWVTAGEATMSPAERAFVEENAEDRDADRIARAELGGFDPNILLGFPDTDRHD
jgi:hypothetical protein